MTIAETDNLPSPEQIPSERPRTSPASLIQQGAKASRVSLEWGWAALSTSLQTRRSQRLLQTNLRQLGRVALDAAFNDSAVDELQAQTKHKYRVLCDIKSAIGEIEGAAMPDDPQQRAREASERRARTVDFRTQLGHIERELDQQFLELGQAVLSGSSSHPGVVQSVRQCQTIQQGLDRAANWKAGLRADWQSMPSTARYLGLGLDILLVLCIGLVGWAVSGAGTAAEHAGSRRIATGEAHTSVQVDARSDAVPEIHQDDESEVRVMPATSEASNTQPAAGDDERQVEPAAKLPDANLPAAQFSGKILTSTDRSVHRFQVEPAFETLLIDEAVHHLGDNTDGNWQQPAAEATELVWSFQFPADIPDTQPTLQLDLFDCDFQNSVRLNGQAIGSLPQQAATSFRPVSVAIPRQLLRSGTNELVLTTAADQGGNHDDLMVKNLRLVAGPALYRVELSRLPGTDTKLQCFKLSGGQRLPQFELNHLLKEGEEIHPNWAAAAGTYEFEVSADGVNPDVEYILRLDPIAYLTAGDEREPNNRPADSTPIHFEEKMRAFLPWQGDQDMFRFSLEEEAVVRIDVEGIPDVDLALRVCSDPRNREIRSVDAQGAGQGEQIRLLKLGPGLHRLTVSAAQGGPVNPQHPYQLLLRKVPLRPGFELEPNDRPELANPVNVNESIRGHHEPPGEEDWFVFQVDESPQAAGDKRRIVRVRITSLDGVEYLPKLYARDRRFSWGRKGTDYVVSNWLVEPGPCRIGVAGRVSGKPLAGQTYRLRVDLLDRPESGYAVGNDTPEAALVRTPEQPFRSALYPWESADYYKMTFDDDQIVYRLHDLRRTLRRGTLGIEIQDALGKPILTLADTPLENWTPLPGSYLFKVFRRHGGHAEEHYEWRFEEERVCSSSEEREFNNTTDTASELKPNLEVHGWFAPVGDTDWYRLDIPAASRGSVYRLELKSDSSYADVALRILAADGKTSLLELNNQPAGKAERVEKWSFQPGTHYVHVALAQEALNRNVEYTLRCEETGRQQEGVEFEPNNQLAQATPLRLDLLSNGRCDSRHDVDFFALRSEFQQTRIIQFRLHGSDQAHFMTLLDGEGKVVAPERAADKRKIDFHNYALAPGATYYVKIRPGRRFQTDKGDYVLKALDRGPWHESREAEPNGDGLTPTPLVPAVSLTGVIPRRDDVDWYVWDASQLAPYQRLIIEPAANQRLEIEATFQPRDGAAWPLFKSTAERRFELPNFRQLDGQVLIKLSTRRGGLEPYRLLVESQPQRVTEQDIEPDNQEPLFKRLEPGQVAQGSFYAHNDYDNYLVLADGTTAFDLSLSSSGRRPTELEILPLDSQERPVVKQFSAQKGEQQILRAWQPAAGRHLVRVHAAYGDAQYSLGLERATSSGQIPEPNDRWQDATPLQLGKHVRGLLDVRNDKDYYRLNVTAEQGQTVQLHWRAPPSSDISWYYRHSDGKEYMHLIPAGQALQIPNALLGAGDHYFGVAWRQGPGEYTFGVDAAEPYDPSRGYQAWGTDAQRIAADTTIRGRLIPFITDREQYAFQLDHPAAVLVEVSGIANGNVDLAVWNERTRQWLEANRTGTGQGEFCYFPFLEQGRYLIRVQATAKPEARDYTLRLQQGVAGHFFATGQDPTPRYISHSIYGGHIVRVTSEYNGSWRARQLLDGGTQSNGWCSANAQLPHEIVIGFLDDRPVRIDQVSVNPAAKDNLAHWVKEVEVLVSRTRVRESAEPEVEQWESLGRIVTHQEDKFFELNLPQAEQVSAVMIRIHANHGSAQYLEMGEIRVREAGSPAESLLRDRLAVELEKSHFGGGVNLLLSRLGGQVASFSSQNNQDWLAQHLIDGVVLANAGWASTVGLAEPSEVVLELPAELPLARLVFSNRIGWEGYYRYNRIKDLEVWLSRTGPAAGFEKVSTVYLDVSAGWKSFRLPAPRRARWIKLRGLTNHGGKEVFNALGEVMAFAEPAGQVQVQQIQQAYPDKPFQLPGVVQLADFDRASLSYQVRSQGGDDADSAVFSVEVSGEGITYHDLTTANDGNARDRRQSVDIQQENGTRYLTRVRPGEWTEYTIDISAPGSYALETTASAAGSHAAFSIEFDGQDRTESLVIPGSRSGRGWQKVTTRVRLTKGRHVMRISLDHSEPADAKVRLKSVQFTKDD